MRRVSWKGRRGGFWLQVETGLLGLVREWVGEEG